jgi:hypothetical protein
MSLAKSAGRNPDPDADRKSLLGRDDHITNPPLPPELHDLVAAAYRQAIGTTFATGAVIASCCCCCCRSWPCAPVCGHGVCPLKSPPRPVFVAHRLPVLAIVRQE